MSSESEANLHAAITTSGQVQRDIYRLQLERFTEVLDSFRSTMLRMFEDTTNVVGARMDALEASDAALDARVAALEARNDDG